MNFEYKVGYLWKYHEEDPGLQNWKREISIEPLGRNVRSARADWSTFAYRQCSSSGSQLWCYFMLLKRLLTTGSQNSLHFYFFSFFSFLFSFPLLSSLVLHFAACWKCPFGDVRVPGSEKLKLGSCPDRPRALPTSAGSCVPRFLLNWRPNFCIFKFVSSSPHLFLMKVGMIYT